MCCNGFRIVLMFTLVVLSFFFNAYTPSIPVVIWYLIAINIFTFLLFGIDKFYAYKERQRVPEFSFYFFSVAGGVVGVLLGVVLLRHKNHKRTFFAFELGIGLLWLIALWYVVSNLEKIQAALQQLAG